MPVGKRSFMPINNVKLLNTRLLAKEEILLMGQCQKVKPILFCLTLGKLDI